MKKLKEILMEAEGYCPKCGSRLYPGDEDYINKTGVCSHCVTYDKTPDKRFQQAFADASKPKGSVSRRQLKETITDSVLCVLNELDYESDYKRGINFAVAVRQGKKKPLEKDDLESASPAFRNGYVSLMFPSLWTKFNDWLTNVAGRLGYSLIRKL